MRLRRHKPTSWFGFYRSTELPLVNPILITPEIIQADCNECFGDGDWTKYMPNSEELEPRSVPCNDCKGTGRKYF